MKVSINNANFELFVETKLAGRFKKMLLEVLLSTYTDMIDTKGRKNLYLSLFIDLSSTKLT
jgi:hypothetical protein